MGELSELGEPVELGELSELGELVNWKNWVTPNLETLKKILYTNLAYCRTATCKTCKFRPLSDRPTAETDVQNRRFTTSIYIALFQIGLRLRTSKY